MAITTYAELKTAVAGWLDVTASDLTSQIDDLITVAEKRIFRECRTRDMETALAATISGSTIAVPTSYVALKLAYVDTSPIQKLERRSAEWIYTQYPLRSSSGRPKFIGRDVNTFVFGPPPDSAYTIKGTYYVRLGALSGTVNALFTANPDLYLLAALAESSMIIGDDARVPIWDAKYQRAMADVNGEATTEDQSGSGLRMRVG